MVRQLKARHSRTVYTTNVDSQPLKIQMTEGVAQGDPNAQTLFVITYEEFGTQVDSARADNIHMEFKPPTSIAEELSNLSETISLHQHMFVDDHAEIHCFNNLAEIAELITPILGL